MPRYFNYNVLDYSLQMAYTKLPLQIINQIVSSDLEILYIEALKKFKNPVLVKEPLINKIGGSFIDNFRKYYNYGKTQKFLSNTAYSNLYNFKYRKRKYGLRYLDVALLIYITRGIPFYLGYYFNLSIRLIN